MIIERRIIRPISIRRGMYIDADWAFAFDVPDELHHRIPQEKAASIFLEGHKDNVRVALELPAGSVLLNDFAPADAIFAVNSTAFHGPVRTDSVSRIELSPGRDYRDVTTYGILHAIGRLLYHDDTGRHVQSLEAHAALEESLTHLYEYDDIKLKGKGVESWHELDYWRIIASEEREVSVLTLGIVKNLMRMRRNPLPHIKTYRALTSLVNTDRILRTATQMRINPNVSGSQLGAAMTLSEQEVTRLINLQVA